MTERSELKMKSITKHDPTQPRKSSRVSKPTTTKLKNIEQQTKKKPTASAKKKRKNNKHHSSSKPASVVNKSITKTSSSQSVENFIVIFPASSKQDFIYLFAARQDFISFSSASSGQDSISCRGDSTRFTVSREDFIQKLKQ